MIYLDNAATSSPKPEAVYATLGSFLGEPEAGGERAARRPAARDAAAVSQTRQKLARLFGVADPRRVIFTLNATDALNLAIKGFLSAGDHVVTTTMEHNSVRRSLRALEVAGVVTTKVAAGPDGIIAPEQIREALGPNTRMVAITHASNVNGAIQPIEAIAATVREHGAFLLVDAAQTAGAVPIDLTRLGADLLALPGHKWLMGPPGTGALILGPRIDPDDLTPVRDGGTSGGDEADIQPHEIPARYEAGMLNTVGIAALGAALDFALDTGVAPIGAHEREMADRLIEGLRTIPGVQVLSPRDPERRVAVVSFTVEGWVPADFAAALADAYGVDGGAGLHCAPEACRTLGAFPHGTIRLSPGFFTSPDEIDRAVEAVNELAKAPLQMV